MARVLQEHIAQAVHGVGAMSLAEKERLASEIYELQPNLLASVLVQGNLGTSKEDLDPLLHILFVCFEAVRAAGLQLPTVSENVQDACLARIVGRARFSEDLSSEMRSKAIEDQIENHSERYLLALVVCELRAHELTEVRTDADKYFVMAALNLVESIAQVSEDA